MSSNPPASPWESMAYLSPSRLTRMGHVCLPGTSITGGINTSITNLNPIYSNMIVTCTETGGGFVKDQTYIRNTDNTAWIGISGGVHLHDDASENAGGLFADILLANQQRTYFFNDLAPAAGSYAREGSSGLVGIDDVSNGCLSLVTGGTSGNWLHLSRSGVKLSFSKPSQFMFKGHVSYTGSNSNVTSYIGVGVASVNTTTNAVQYGLQVCDTAGIERNWEMVQANGIIKGTVGTTEPVNRPTGPRGFKLKYTPGSGTQLWVNGVLNQTNTEEVVSGGSSSGIRNISFGIRTNNSTTKSLNVYGISLVGATNDNQWL